MWSTDDCYDAFCWPGFETDGMLVELEYQDAEGLELSGVNVPAVDDTYVVDPNVAEQARAADRMRWMETELTGPRSSEALKMLEDQVSRVGAQIADSDERARATLAGLEARLANAEAGEDPAAVIDEVVSRLAQRLAAAPRCRSRAFASPACRPENSSSRPTSLPQLWTTAHSIKCLPRPARSSPSSVVCPA